jgi:uncharacterized protein
LKNLGVKVLALDFDGVLANHGETALLPEVMLWLDEAEEVFGANRIFILSNKPAKARSDYFTEHFTGVGFIYGVRKKPYPDGLLKAAEMSGTDPSTMILIDDRLMTGGLAAILAGSRFLWITRPYIDMQKRPAREGFFKVIRSLEKAFVRMMGMGQK